MPKLRYSSPMKDKYVERGEILMDGSVLAEMATTDDFIFHQMATFKHGSDGGGLQMEIDEIGQKLVKAFNHHDQLVAIVTRALASRIDDEWLKSARAIMAAIEKE